MGEVPLDEYLLLARPLLTDFKSVRSFLNYLLLKRHEVKGKLLGFNLTLPRLLSSWLVGTLVHSLVSFD